MSSSSGCSPVPPAPLAAALAARGHTDLTAVQAAVLAARPAERDLVVSAPTGSGKTVAFGLALAPHLLEARVRDGRPLALVVAPTRELAAQITGELDWLYAGTGVRILCLTGGRSLRWDAARLAEGRSWWWEPRGGWRIC